MIPINKISIGTAQFGFDYGISNKKGIVRYQEILKILNFAKQNNIKSIDTAYLYGKSEKYLGNYNLDKWEITTKFPKVINFSNIGYFFDKTINESINNLKVNKLESVLLHYPDQILSENGNQIIFNLELLKKKNITNKVGYTISDLGQLRTILNKYTPDVIQLPFNVFDRRILDLKLLEFLKKKNVEIHLRSIFLQGLLLMNTKVLPRYFLKWKKLFFKWNEWLLENNLSPLEGSLGIIKENYYYDKIIFGVTLACESPTARAVRNSNNECLHTHNTLFSTYST